MIKAKNIIALLLILFSPHLFAQGTVSTQGFYSTSLGSNINYNIYLPPSYSQNNSTQYPYHVSSTWYGGSIFRLGQQRHGQRNEQSNSKWSKGNDRRNARREGLLVH